jgi:hypothetical protein
MRAPYFVLFLAPLLLLPAIANAQRSYQCTTNGRTYFSSQPCPSAGLEYRGPLESPSTYVPPIPKIGTAPDFLDRLSPRCSSLNDAIRTAPARGLKADTISDLRQEYREKCAEEENDARNQIRSDQRDKKKQQQETQQLEARAQERTALQQQQCDESKRIIYTKQKRTDLTDGEKADFQRFVDNHHRRCG